MAILADIITFLLLVGGVISMLVGSYGLLKMPDVFARMHAAGMVDTLGLGMIMVGLMVQAGISLITFKLFLIIAFVLYTGPAVTHALAQACLNNGVEPLVDDDRRPVDRKLGDEPSST